MAVVGVERTLPDQVRGLDDLETALREGRECVEEISSSRWDVDALHDPDPLAQGEIYIRHGGFVDDADGSTRRSSGSRTARRRPAWIRSSVCCFRPCGPPWSTRGRAGECDAAVVAGAVPHPDGPGPADAGRYAKAAGVAGSVCRRGVGACCGRPPWRAGLRRGVSGETALHGVHRYTSGVSHGPDEKPAHVADRGRHLAGLRGLPTQDRPGVRWRPWTASRTRTPRQPPTAAAAGPDPFPAARPRTAEGSPLPALPLRRR